MCYKATLSDFPTAKAREATYFTEYTVEIDKAEEILPSIREFLNKVG
jgi:hypothetical protein